MNDMDNLDKIQGRRFMVRFDLPDQDLAQWTDASVHAMVDDALGRWEYVGQLERGGRNDRYHVQAYVESPSDSPIRLGSIVRSIRKQTDTEKKTVSVYVRRAQKTAARCVAYVSKQDTRIWGPWSSRPMDAWPLYEHEERIDKEDLFDSVMREGATMADILNNPEMSVAAASCMRWLASLIRQRDGNKWGVDGPERDLEVLYLYGASGTGKSTVARQYLDAVVGKNNYFPATDYVRDTWGEYACQRGVLLDELRLPTPQISLTVFLQITDRFPVQLSRRYENSWAAYDHMVITSNWSPDRQWESIKTSSSPTPSEEDRVAFMRRFTRILHVKSDGTIADESDRYHQGVDSRPKITLAQLQNTLEASTARLPIEM